MDMALVNESPFLRAAIVVAVLVVSLPLGLFLGSLIISTLTENIVTGVLVLAGSVAITATMGLGLYIVAEGEVPTFLRKYMAA